MPPNQPSKLRDKNTPYPSCKFICHLLSLAYLTAAFFPLSIHATSNESISYNFDKINDDIVITNPGIGLSNFNTTSSHKIITKPMIGPTSYNRFYWNEIEDKKLGAYDFSKIDAALSSAVQHNEYFGFRIMSAKPADTSAENSIKIPTALLNPSNSREKIGDFLGKTFVPNYNNSQLILAASNLIHALGVRYANHPNLLFIDVGLVGFWGEWHLGGSGDYNLPNYDNAKHFVEMHLNSFPNTKAVMLIGNGTKSSIQTLNDTIKKHNVGWRADGWGDFRFLDDANDNHTVVYTKILNSAPNLQDAWKLAPVILETPNNLTSIIGSGSYITKSSPHLRINQAEKLNASFDFAIKNHASSINSVNPEIDFLRLPANILDTYKKTLARLGYRFYLYQAEAAQRLHSGEKLTIVTHWKNLGNAPSYGNYQIAYRLKNSKNITAIKISDKNVNIDQWLPVDYQSTHTHKISLNTEGLHGKFSVETAILTRFDWPVRLANQKNGKDNWLEIGTVTLD